MSPADAKPMNRVTIDLAPGMIVSIELTTAMIDAAAAVFTTAGIALTASKHDPLPVLVGKALTAALKAGGVGVKA